MFFFTTALISFGGNFYGEFKIRDGVSCCMSCCLTFLSVCASVSKCVSKLWLCVQCMCLLQWLTFSSVYVYCYVNVCLFMSVLLLLFSLRNHFISLYIYFFPSFWTWNENRTFCAIDGTRHIADH